jgi:hypothetical protein
MKLHGQIIDPEIFQDIFHLIGFLKPFGNAFAQHHVPPDAPQVIAASLLFFVTRPANEKAADTFFLFG